jgi:tripartite-type tricarboxylate transporter receptor subunit TctC
MKISAHYLDINVSERRKTMRRRTCFNLKAIQIFVIVLLSFAIAAAGSASPSPYPAKPIEVVVPFAPGGADVAARILVEALSKRWKQAINVLNKPGGNCVIGTNYVMRAVPDGYTILFDSGASSSMQAFMTDLPYKLEERTFMVGTHVLSGAFVVPAKSPWQNLNEVAGLVKKRPGSFTWASLGGISQADLQMRQFFVAAGIEAAKTKIVPFPGAGPAVNAVAGEHVQLGAGSANAVLALIGSGLIRCIGITSSQRLEEFPNVPTTIEQGFPSVNTVYWGGFSGPLGVPAEVVKTWIQTLKEVVNDPEVVSRLKERTIRPMYLDSNGLKAFVLEETQMVKQFLGGK